MSLLLRCIIGGVVVSLFAILGDVLKPLSLGGTTAAAPAIALASLVITLREKGLAYTVTESRSMVAGAIAFLVFAVIVSQVQMRLRPKALLSASLLLSLWAITSALLWAVWLRH